MKNMKSASALALALLACTLATANAATTHTVTMRDFSYTPKTLTINAGDTVRWVNQQGSHDVVASNGAFRSAFPVQQFTFTFNNPGTFNYFCTPHAGFGMTGTITVVAADAAPTVAITSPAAGAVFTEGVPFEITATATDDKGVASVEFFAGGTSLGLDTTAPYSVAATLAAGNHILTAIAKDTANQSTLSSQVSITVNPAANQLPTVAITAPAPGTLIAAGGSVLLSATANDPDGSIASVEFFDGQRSLGLRASPPYNVTLADLPAGKYNLAAVATDNKGGSTTSAIVLLNVATPPRILSIMNLGGDHFHLTVQATPGITHVLEGTHDFHMWSPIATNIAQQTGVEFIDFAHDMTPKRFYRVFAR